MSVTHLVRRTTSHSKAAFLMVLPHGGQELARRNAWASMAADVARARARREADVAMDRAIDSAVAAAHPVAAHA